MILRNVQPSAAGTYECEATIIGSQMLRGSAGIQLQVYGKLVSGCGYSTFTALGATEFVLNLGNRYSHSYKYDF